MNTVPQRSYQDRLVDFVTESNRIEGIRRAPTEDEIAATEEFLRLSHVTLQDLQLLVARLQPGAVLRDRGGLNVRVGTHYPPPGGPAIARGLMQLLYHDPSTELAWWRHQAYETLHPFTDGNGRSGRALWLRDMGGVMGAPLGFLHHWYYQSLENGRAGEPTWPST